MYFINLLIGIAEWSFQYLRRQCQVSREALITQKVARKHKAEDTNLDIKETIVAAPSSVSLLDSEVGARQDPTEGSEDEAWYSATSLDNLLSDEDIISFGATWDGTLGRLVIRPGGLRFVRAVRSKQMWEVPFVDILEILKFRDPHEKKSKLSGLRSKGELELKTVTGHGYKLSGIKHRDDVFNYIIGFSGLYWQSLQTGPGVKNVD